jgi:hypothetical protein
MDRVTLATILQAGSDPLVLRVLRDETSLIVVLVRVELDQKKQEFID